MTRSEHPERILFVSLKEEAEPLLSELRASGHQVSIVDRLEDAQAILASGGFNQAIVPGRTLGSLLTQHSLWEEAGGDSWRRSTVALAHDLRNLLQTLEQCIQALTALHAADGTQPEGLLDLLRTISTLSTFLMELTDELDAGSSVDLTFAQLDLEDAVEAAAVAVYPSASERRQRLVIDIDEEARYVRADPTRMKRALSYLLSHASHQSPSRGTVTVSARRDSDDCVVCISYTAETASPAALSELFRRPGVDVGGSGLYQVQNIIERHSGRLWLESQRGSGTSVFLSLPLEGLPRKRGTLSLTPG